MAPKISERRGRRSFVSFYRNPNPSDPSGQIEIEIVHVPIPVAVETLRALADQLEAEG